MGQGWNPWMAREGSSTRCRRRGPKAIYKKPALRSTCRRHLATGERHTAQLRTGKQTYKRAGAQQAWRRACALRLATSKTCPHRAARTVCPSMTVLYTSAHTRSPRLRHELPRGVWNSAAPCETYQPTLTLSHRIRSPRLCHRLPRAGGFPACPKRHPYQVQSPAAWTPPSKRTITQGLASCS